MTREWTKVELDTTWPLLEGWVWARDMFDEDEGWVWTAELVGSIDTVWVSEGIVGFAGDGPPVEVTLAVCMVALGLDSREVIAEAMGSFAETVFGAGLAKMIRRGTVKP